MPADDFVVTPWNVEGDIDYDKLIKRFGTQKITPDLLSKIEKLPLKMHFLVQKIVKLSSLMPGFISDTSRPPLSKTSCALAAVFFNNVL